jgi:glucose/arabinose dehydrogenase
VISRTVAGVALAVVVAACGGSSGDVLVPRAPQVTAMVPLPGGGLMYGERTTGRIIEAGGGVAATVDVASNGQRGLLGLARYPDGRIFASWTRRDGRIVVGLVAPLPRRLVWLGPHSVRIANGGHLVRAPDGSLVIGIGDLQDPGAVSDRNEPNGKLLRLDADGPPDQRPETISYGWNNPFAFTFTPSGKLWLADNAPGKQRERLLRADPTGPAAYLPAHTAPSGLAALDDDALVMCGYATKVLQRYRIGANGLARPEGGPIARDCRFGVVALTDGRVAYSTGTSIKTLRP